MYYGCETIGISSMPPYFSLSTFSLNSTRLRCHKIILSAYTTVKGTGYPVDTYNLMTDRDHAD